MPVIVVMMTLSIGSEIEGEMIAGDPRGIVIGTVRGVTRIAADRSNGQRGAEVVMFLPNRSNR